MKNALHDHGFGTKWTDVYVEKRERYRTSVTDFHEHDFYEINLILSGNVKVLLANQICDGTESKLVFTKPNTPHFISCKPDVLYKSLYLVFTDDFISTYIPEWKQLLSEFGKSGKIVALSDEQKEYCRHIIVKIQEETAPFRQKLLIMYLLSYINDFSGTDNPNFNSAPPYIIKALSYIDEHYQEKITAAELAKNLFVCRTTLMTEFKKYTGSTLNNFIIHCRLKSSVELLCKGSTQQQAAEKCGFGDVSSLIRNFKKYFNMTPRQYLLNQNIKKQSYHK